MSFVADLRVVLQGRDFRRLFGTRLVSQFSDGIFQFSVLGFAFFNPDKHTSAVDVALGFAVLFLPYSLLGPFVGVFIDRWSRRQILVIAPIVRGSLLLLTAAVLVSGLPEGVFYGLALCVLGVNRFFMAALSAALPHVVPHDRLMAANAVTPTSGTVITFGGVAVGYLMREVFHSHIAVMMIVSGAVFGLSSLVARTMSRDLLGPDADAGRPSTREAIRGVVAGLVDGVRHLMSHRAAAATVGAMALHRFMFGMATALGIILYRYYFTGGDATTALQGMGLVVATSGVGFALAVVVTPLATERFTIERWVPWMLATAGVATALLVAPFQEWGLPVAGFVLGIAGQSVKICADTTVQRDVEDVYLGRAFSIYDMLFNGMFVLAAALSALILPANGKSYLAIAIIAIGYVGGGLGYRMLTRRRAASLS
ncbi:MFS transporter [Nonomuraea sp. NBC_01738]|uniref:MFS transporter n=1 Tax=Nonomuraea sp. NBC_01738 TaxID=2976003 RepID=UPI002E12BE95|nr:MFS transporter [Nonomuraea sp. NBC_01738]